MEKSDAEAGWVPLGAELGFGSVDREGNEPLFYAPIEFSEENGLPGIQLKGSIDRLDLNVKTGEIRVTDYKTGKNTFKVRDIDTRRDLLQTNECDKAHTSQLHLYSQSIKDALKRGDLDGLLERHGISVEAGTTAPSIGARLWHVFPQKYASKEVLSLDEYDEVAETEFMKHLQTICGMISRGEFPARRFSTQTYTPAEIKRFGQNNYERLSKHNEDLKPKNIGDRASEQGA